MEQSTMMRYNGHTTEVGARFFIEVLNGDLIYIVDTATPIVKINQHTTNISHEHLAMLINQSTILGKRTPEDYNIEVQKYLETKYHTEILEDKYSLDNIMSRGVKFKKD